MVAQEMMPPKGRVWCGVWRVLNTGRSLVGAADSSATTHTHTQTLRTLSTRVASTDIPRHTTACYAISGPCYFYKIRKLKRKYIFDIRAEFFLP